MVSNVEQEKVSIGLPIFNGDQFLCRRLESILGQTYKNIELIISDNGSTDTTEKICKDYLHKDKRIRYIRQKKDMGILWNFGNILNEAQNNFFVWATVDDIWEPNFLEKYMLIWLF